MTISDLLGQPTQDDMVYLARAIAAANTAAEFMARHATNARWDVVSRAMLTLEETFAR